MPAGPLFVYVEHGGALAAWLLCESPSTRDRLDRARGSLQAAGLPSPHVNAMSDVAH